MQNLTSKPAVENVLCSLTAETCEDNLIKTHFKDCILWLLRFWFMVGIKLEVLTHNLDLRGLINSVILTEAFVFDKSY